MKIVGLAATAALAPLVFSGCAVDQQRLKEEQRTEAFDLFTSGERLEEKGEYQQALDKFTAALELNERPAFLYKAGLMHEELGNFDRALFFYDRSLEISPDYELAAARRELVRLRLNESDLLNREGRINIQQVESEEELHAEVPSPYDEPIKQPPAVTEEDYVSSPFEGTDTGELIVEEDVPSPYEEPIEHYDEELVPEPKMGDDGEGSDDELPFTAISEDEDEVDYVVNVDGDEVDQLESERPHRVPVIVAEAAKETPVKPEKTSTVTKTKTAATSFERVKAEEVRDLLFPEFEEYEPEEIAQERQRAETAVANARWSDAVLSWSRIVNFQPGDTGARLQLAKALLKSGRVRRSMEEYAKAADLAPIDANVHLHWGNSLVEINETDEAEVHYLTAIELDASNVKARNNLGALYLNVHRYQDSIRELEEALRMHPDFAPAHLNLAFAYDSSGDDVGKVIEHLKDYLRLDGERRGEAEEWLMQLRSK